jgi:hypothetical protein
MKDKTDNSNNRFALAARMNRLISDGPFPFWGCPKRDALTTLSVKKSRDHTPNDLPEYRLTETFLQANTDIRPQPVWKIAYAGAVGGQAMTGIPVIDKLRGCFDSMRLWPFELQLEDMDTERLEDIEIVAVEIQPTIVPFEPKEGEFRDESQVRLIAERFAELDESGKLGKLFSNQHALPEGEIKTVCEEEGWIFGI